MNLYEMSSNNNEEDNKISNDNENLAINTLMARKDNENHNICNANSITQVALDSLLLLVSKKDCKVR